MRAMSDRAACEQRRSSQRRFSNLRVRGVQLSRTLHMKFDAIRTLGGEGHGHGNEFLIFPRNRPLAPRGLVECEKPLHRLGCMRFQLLELLEMLETHAPET